MKGAFLKYGPIQPKKAISVHEKPHPVFLTRITADPYAGCKYACPYCYVVQEKPSCFVKTNIVGRLRKKLEELSATVRHPDLRPSIMLGGMTDPYQEAEDEMMVTRRCLELIAEKEFPLQIFTKSAGVLRDAELLSRHSSKGLATVNITLFSLNDAMWRTFENNVPQPVARLDIISKLKKKGVLCGVVLMPVFPFLNDTQRDIERIFRAAKKAGAEYIIPGCFRPSNAVVGRRISGILKEKFRDIADKSVSADYLASLEKTLYGLSEKYDIPLNIPVPGAKPAVDLNPDPVL